MNTRPWHTLVLAGFLFVSPVLGQAQEKLPVPVPDGTQVAPIKYGEAETAVDLQPAEQVAFLFVSSIWGLEEQCLDKDSGIGRLCSLGELIKGAKRSDGRTIGLSVTPARDTNYRYDVLLIGDACVIRALPRVKGLGAFALFGSPKGFGSSFYYDPKGPELINAEKVTERGYSGSSFTR